MTVYCTMVLYTVTNLVFLVLYQGCQPGITSFWLMVINIRVGIYGTAARTSDSLRVQEACFSLKQDLDEGSQLGASSARWNRDITGL